MHRLRAMHHTLCHRHSKNFILIFSTLAKILLFGVSGRCNHQSFNAHDRDVFTHSGFQKATLDELKEASTKLDWGEEFRCNHLLVQLFQLLFISLRMRGGNGNCFKMWLSCNLLIIEQSTLDKRIMSIVTFPWQYDLVHLGIYTMKVDDPGTFATCVVLLTLCESKATRVNESGLRAESWNLQDLV